MGVAVLVGVLGMEVGDGDGVGVERSTVVAVAIRVGKSVGATSCWAKLQAESKIKIADRASAVRMTKIILSDRKTISSGGMIQRFSYPSLI